MTNLDDEFSWTQASCVSWLVGDESQQEQVPKRCWSGGWGQKPIDPRRWRPPAPSTHSDSECPTFRIKSFESGRGGWSITTRHVRKLQLKTRKTTHPPHFTKAHQSKYKRVHPFEFEDIHLYLASVNVCWRTTICLKISERVQFSAKSLKSAPTPSQMSSRNERCINCCSWKFYNDGYIYSKRPLAALLRIDKVERLYVKYIHK